MKPDLLLRPIKTLPLEEVNRRESLSMLENVFDITSQKAQKIKDRNIVLIDDVMTPGAMLSAAAKTLIKEGLSYICVLVLERVTENA